MLTYRGVSPRIVVQTQRGGPPPADASHAPAAAPAPDVVDISLFLDDYKTVDGVLLPHRFTRSVGGETTEDVTCKSMKVNPSFKTEFSAR